MIRSFKPIERWWHETLDQGSFDYTDRSGRVERLVEVKWEGSIEKAVLHANCRPSWRSTARHSDTPINRNGTRDLLKKVALMPDQRRLTGTDDTAKSQWALHPLEECRKLWDPDVRLADNGHDGRASRRPPLCGSRRTAVLSARVGQVGQRLVQKRAGSYSPKTTLRTLRTLWGEKEERKEEEKKFSKCTMLEKVGKVGEVGMRAVNVGENRSGRLVTRVSRGWIRWMR